MRSPRSPLVCLESFVGVSCVGVSQNENTYNARIRSANYLGDPSKGGETTNRDLQHIFYNVCFFFGGEGGKHDAIEIAEKMYRSQLEIRFPIISFRLHRRRNHTKSAI